jgi:Putative addiction module component
MKAAPARHILVLSKPTKESYASFMATIFEVEKLALDLPEQERAKLAANLLHSLPGVLSDKDEGIAEAIRRDAEIDRDPNQAITLAQLETQIQNRRG